MIDARGIRTRIRTVAIRALCLFLTTLLIPNIALAFKIDMHVWIAQQVLNDVLDDGRLSIAPFGSYSVDAATIQALRDYPDEYRMGAIGPDGFPDLAGGQLTVHPGVPGGWRTDQWLAWMLEGATTPRERAFAFGYLTHAASDVFAHSYVNTYTGDFFDLFDGQEAEIRHMALEEFMKKHMPPIRDNNGTSLNAYNIVEAPAAFLRDHLILNPTVADQYRKQPNTLYLALMYEYWHAIGQVVDEVKVYRQQAKNVIDDIQDEIDDLDDRIDDLKDIRVSIFGQQFNLYPGYCFIDPGTCTIIWSLEATLATTKLSLEVPKQVHNAIIYSIQAPLDAWQGEIEEALKQYMVTSGEIAIELMKPSWPEGMEKSCFDSRYASPKCKLDAWICEWSPVFAGIPNEASVPTCAAGNALGRAVKLQQDLRSGIDSVRGLVAGKLGIFGWAVDPAYQVQLLIENHVKPTFKDLALDITESLLTRATGENSVTLDLLTFRTEEQTAAKLADIFSVDSSGKGLLLVPDAPNRVAWEMGLPGNDPNSTATWDPNKYNVAHNAIVLSKLLLLGSGQLNLMVKRAGVGNTIYGPDLYDPNTFKNILIDAVGSIDGDHQWQEVAPRSPRQSGRVDTKTDEQRRYGYAFDGQRGFRLWQDCQVRDKVFNRIFHGPLTPGIENPPAALFTDLLSPGDENRILPDDPMYPFPLSSGSSLPLKVTARDSEPFSIFNWAAANGDFSALWQSLSLSSVTRVASVREFALPVGIGARNLVLELNSHVCGGQNGVPVTTDWTFMDTCTYECTCREGLFHFTSCTCSSNTCESQLIRFLDEIQDGLVHNFTDTSTCGICHNNTGRLQAGTMTLTKRGIPTPAQEGRGLTLNGALICDAHAPETNLVMPAVASSDLRVNVTNPVSGEAAVADATYETNYTDLAATFLDWTDVDNAIIQSSNGREGACGLIAMTDDSALPEDLTPPAISPPADIQIDCADYRARMSSGQTVSDLLGSPIVQDDRDGSPVVTNNAPAALSAGSTVVVWTATDAAGNAASTQQLVTVTDLLSPVFTVTLPAISVSASGTETPVFLESPTAHDGCDGAIQATTQTDLTAFAIGETNVLWKAQDSSGNIATTSQTVQVSAIPGDVNGDGIVNQADLNLVLDGLVETSLAATGLADFDGNGQIDAADEAILALIQQGASDPRDFNSDGSISAADAGIAQGLCNGSCQVLAQPTDLYGRAKPDKTNLVWTPVDGYSYRVFRSEVSGGPYQQAGTVALGVYVDPAVTSGKTYYYVVQAETPISRSILSNEIAMVIPSARRRR